MIFTKSTIAMPAFTDLGNGSAYTCRRIYWCWYGNSSGNNVISINEGWWVRGTSGSTNNNLVIPQHIYGIKI